MSNDGSVMEPAGGMEPYVGILPVGRRFLLIARQSVDHSPDCEDGCLTITYEGKPPPGRGMENHFYATLLGWREP